MARASPQASVARANEFSASRQDQVALADLPDGRIVVAWHSRRQNGGRDSVRARWFDPALQPAGGELALHDEQAWSRSAPAIAATSDGAWVAWESFGEDGEGSGVFLRRFAGGAFQPVTAQLAVPGSVAGDQSEPALATTVEGGALLVWTTPHPDGAGRILRACSFGPGGELGGEPAGVSEHRPEVGVTCASIERVAADRFLVAWSARDARGRPLGVFVRALDAHGRVAGAALRVAEPDVLPIEPALASDGVGRAVVAWLEPVRDRFRISYRRIAWNVGEWRLEPSRALPEGEAPRRTGLAVAASPTHELALAWSQLDERGREADLHVARIDASEELLSAATEVAAGAADQRLDVARGTRRCAYTRDGRLVVAWSGDAGLGDGSGAHVSVLGERWARDLVGGCEESWPAAQPHEPPMFDPSVAFSPPASGGPPPAVGPDHGFVAIGNSGWNPPDPGIAVGPTHLVLTTNGRIAFALRDGTVLASQPLEGAWGFFASVGASWFVFDPEVTFDPLSGRFFVAAIERDQGRPYFLLGVSATSDPQGAWFKHRIDVGSLAGDDDIDSANLSVGPAWVALSADFFGPDQHFVYVLDKSALVTGSLPAGTSSSLFGAGSCGLPPLASNAAVVYLLEANTQGQANSIDLFAITDPLGVPVVHSVTLNVPTYQQPENPPQFGASQRPETFDARFWSVAQSGGSLWATHHVNATRVRQRWYQIALGGWPIVAGAVPSLAQSGEIDLGGDVRTCFGAIATDPQHNVALVFTRTSPNEPLSIARTYRRLSDPLGTLRPPEMVQVSSTPDTSGRWGDYGAVAADPLQVGAFWAHHEVRFAAWTTWVALFGEPRLPQAFCTAKTCSAGTMPVIRAHGAASVGVDDLWLELDQAVPGALAILLRSTQPVSQPFHGGTLCVGPPRQRIGYFQLDAAGSGRLRVPLPVADFAHTFYFQYWFRDGAHPDGWSTGLSGGLKVVVGP